jgi:hypothetical protein
MAGGKWAATTELVERPSEKVLRASSGGGLTLAAKEKHPLEGQAADRMP